MAIRVYDRCVFIILQNIVFYKDILISSEEIKYSRYIFDYTYLLQHSQVLKLKDYAVYNSVPHNTNTIIFTNNTKLVAENHN